jgi:flagellar biosynthesis protein FlhB
MAENSSADKSEQATEHKLRKARQEGQVARSRDLATAVGLIATLGVTAWMLPSYVERFRRIFVLGFADATGQGTLENLWSGVWVQTGGLLALMVTPLFITPVLVALASAIPGGWVFSPKSLAPKSTRMSPKTNLGKLFGAKHHGDLLMSVLKAVAVASVVAWFSSANRARFLALQGLPLNESLHAGLLLMAEGIAAVGSTFIILALVDVPLQRLLFLRQQRMSKQEVKEEMKGMEGRPEVKQRMRQIQRQMARRSIRTAVPTADAVIVNPEHYAVAIRYDAARAQAPYVVAKGVDESALYIREVARQHGVEVLSIPPLARAVYHTSQVNQQIPAALYGAVARTLHHVLQIRAFRNGERSQPPDPPTDIEVPRHLSENQSA